jgi:hypothetical protein
MDSSARGTDLRMRDSHPCRLGPALLGCYQQSVVLR